MNKKVIKDVQDEIESMYFNTEKAVNILKIFSEFVEDEGLVQPSDDEDKKIGCVCFVNRLPMFFSLLEEAIEKNQALKDKLDEINTKLFKIVQEDSCNAGNN